MRYYSAGLENPSSRCTSTSPEAEGLGIASDGCCLQQCSMYRNAILWQVGLGCVTRVANTWLLNLLALEARPLESSRIFRFGRLGFLIGGSGFPHAPFLHFQVRSWGSYIPHLMVSHLREEPGRVSGQVRRVRVLDQQLRFNIFWTNHVEIYVGRITPNVWG